ncbi:MAG: metallo-mystery pair system four-Cys motif protein [Methylocystaceae bacterium]|nr:MAG: metallo-mystery pair system four-Cys motif protein [Methylocystaceae bacterium]
MKMARIAVALASVSIASGAIPSAAAKDRPVSISFALTADGRDVGCGAPLTNLGAGRLESKLHDARFYVYGVKLIDAKGGRTPITLAQNNWQLADVALLDFKDARGGNAPCTETNPPKNTAVTGTAPAGSYVGLEFSVGVPVEGTSEGKTIMLNHSSTETSPPPLDIAVMAWNWQGGRKFLLVEVDPPSYVTKPDGSKTKTWMVHLGSSGCKGNPATGEIVACARENRFTVTFDRFDPKTQRVELDLTRLFAKTDLLVDKGGAVGCMTAPDDPECPAIFEALGLNLVETAPGANDAGKQTKAGASPVFNIGPAKTTSSLARGRQ